MSEVLDDLLFSRRSVRAFLDEPVALDDLKAMCVAARSAPSGANLQPGRLHILTADPLANLVVDLQQAIADNRPFDHGYSYFPKPMPPYLKERQRAAGYALYEALSISRRDLEGRRAQFAHNYRFFGAPVGVIVTIERSMGKGCFMDLGMFLMSFLLKVEDMGYSATGIGAMANYASVIEQNLGLGDDELVVCGLAIGKADQAHPVNQFRTQRAGLEEFAQFYGFER
ncbi:MAG: nitroreductase [Cohaesibacter sp.]|nr:nitroreductase [Cohaesibacter sp.]MCV6603122.1 nitroreductase [Cohaesibacter sp.]